jgi:hypothetical protein
MTAIWTCQPGSAHQTGNHRLTEDLEVWSDQDDGEITPGGIKIEGSRYRWFRLVAPGERSLL